jgi:hypothetical protein
VKRIMIAAALQVLAADLSYGRDVVECSERRGGDNAGYWSWRYIDGRVCWYVGRPGKPKSELYWGRSIPLRTSVKAERPQETVQLIDDKAVPPAAVRVERGEFDRRWNDLLSDMAMPFWRWRQQLSDERLWSNEHD